MNCPGLVSHLSSASIPFDGRRISKAQHATGFAAKNAVEDRADPIGGQRMECPAMMTEESFTVIGIADKFIGPWRTDIRSQGKGEQQNELTQFIYAANDKPCFGKGKRSIAAIAVLRRPQI
jgi:hypothetical protein